MAEEDSDSEMVLLEGSPLYDLFTANDFGLGEIEAVSKAVAVKKDQISTTGTMESSYVFWYSTFVSTFLNWKGEISSHLFKQFKPKQTSNSLNRPMFKLVSQLLFDSKLLSSIDQTLLKGFLEEQDDIDLSISKCENVKSDITGTFKIFQYLGVIIIAVFFNILLSHLGFSKYENNLTWALLFVLSFFLIQKMKNGISNGKDSKFERDMSDFLSRSKDYWKTTRKGLRTIQESELIARGLTFASVRNSSLEASSALPSRFPEKQCPELRAAIFKYSRDYFFACRESTSCLLGMFPLTDGVDMASHYLCNLELGELGPLITTDPNSEAILDVTESYCTPSLKGVIELADAQQSEFLRRVAFCFLSNRDCDWIYREVRENLNRASLVLDSALSGLGKILLYYSLLGRDAGEKNEKVKVVKVDNQVRTFQTSVRSLSLHLQASLVRLQELESGLEAIEQEAPNVVREFIQESAVKCLAEIKSELVAADVCYEDSLLRSTKIVEGVKKEPVNIAPSNWVDETLTKVPVKEPINLFGMGELVVEDQVFEGSAEWSQMDPYDDDLPVPMNKKAPSNLLNELKTVLAVKAEERVIREAKALGIDPSEMTETPEVPLPSNVAEIKSRQSPEGDDVEKTGRFSDEKVEDLISKANSSASSLMTSIAAQAALRSHMFGVRESTFTEDIIADSDSE